MAGTFDRAALIEFFLIEAGDHLQNLNQGLLALEKNPENHEVIDELFRAAHTLKGSAAMMGFQVISEIAHRTEDVLGMIRSKEVSAKKTQINFIFETLDAIKALVNEIPKGKPEDAEIARKINLRYNTLYAPKEPAPEVLEAAAPTPAAEVLTTPEPAPAEFIAEAEVVEEPIPALARSVSGLQAEIEEARHLAVAERREQQRRASDVSEIEKQVIRVNVNQLNNLMNLVGELVVKRNHLIQQLNYIQGVREEIQFSQSRLLKTVRGFEEKYEYNLPSRTLASSSLSHLDAVDFFELEFDRYDDVNLLSRQLVEITNDINEVLHELAAFFEGFEEETAQISRITTSLQEEITSARMVALDRLFQRFTRPVRDLAQSERKKVNILASGGETRIDKTIFEMISDPLIHLIRNAVSHGIEPPEDRSRMGKEETGTILLNAKHEGNNILIEIEDDGRGIDPEFIRSEAVRRGFITPAVAKELSDAEAINLIFLPGFSTHKEISALSGRGVGLDVVTTDLAKINGRIEVQTEVHVGTKFLIKLPLTLVITQALIIRSGEQEFAIPLNTVEETTRFAESEVQRLAGEEMVNLRGRMIPLLRLDRVLGLKPAVRTDGGGQKLPALVLGVMERTIALMVDEIVGREEIVVKPLGEYLKNLRAFTGASISGEGNVRLILDTLSFLGEKGAKVKAVTRVVHREAPPSETPYVPAAPEAPEVAVAAVPRLNRVLVVDDSISIRKYLSHILVKAGFEAAVATQGLEALEILSKEPFDLIITDLEMPVMHGYELMAELKRNPHLSHVPVVVLTSRAGEKHRKKAQEMGALEYLVKPFDEQVLIEATQRILGKVPV
jgi:chemosensory pili system protein ChpA (sensor histidine kinase/response regulator)